MRKQLSILIPTFNDDCLKLVEQLSAQATACQELDSYEIIVADDASTNLQVVHNNSSINDIANCKYIIRRENVGRAAIRNYLAQQAQFELLLFIDSDMTLIKDDFISSYITASAQHQVCYGGYKIIGHHPNNLRFIYEKRNEGKHTALERAKRPNMDFHTSNYIIAKSLFIQHPLDERIRQYGYEDVLYGAMLKKEGITIGHINNPVGFYQFEDNATFLAKTEESLHTLYLFKNELKDCSRLLFIMQTIKSLHLLPILQTIYRHKKSTWKANLCSNNPSMLILKLYKLTYFSSISTHRHP